MAWPWSILGRARRKSASPWCRLGSATRFSCTPRKPSPSWGDDPVTRQDSQDRARGAGPASGAGEARGAQQAGGVESLYPFLYAGKYAGTTDTSAVLEQVRASTLAK